MKISLGNRNCSDDIVFETPRDSLVLSCKTVVQKLELDDKTVWSDLNKLVVKAQENDYLSSYVEKLKQIIIDNHVKNATSVNMQGKGINFEQRENILEIVRKIENSTLERQIASISHSFYSDTEKSSHTSALDSLTLTPESTVSKFFETVSALMSAVHTKDKKKCNTNMDELNSIIHQICVLYVSTHPILTTELGKVKFQLIANVRLCLEHDSRKNTIKLKDSRSLLENILKTLITTSDEKFAKNDSIKLDDFPTVKYNTDQLKERIIRIENQGIDLNGNKISEDSIEYWKTQFLSSQTKYNTLKLYIDDMIFGLGLS